MQEDFQQFFYYRAQSQTVFDTVCVTLSRPTVGHQFNLTGTVPAMLPIVLPVGLEVDSKRLQLEICVVACFMMLVSPLIQYIATEL